MNFTFPACQQVSNKLTLCWSHPSNFGEILVTLRQDEHPSLPACPYSCSPPPWDSCCLPSDANFSHMMAKLVCQVEIALQNYLRITGNIFFHVWTSLHINHCLTLNRNIWKKQNVLPVDLELLTSFETSKLLKRSRKVHIPITGHPDTQSAWIATRGRLLRRHPAERSSFAVASTLLACHFAKLFLEKQSDIDKQDVQTWSHGFYLEFCHGSSMRVAGGLPASVDGLYTAGGIGDCSTNHSSEWDVVLWVSMTGLWEGGKGCSCDALDPEGGVLPSSHSSLL